MYGLNLRTSILASDDFIIVLTSLMTSSKIIRLNSINDLLHFVVLNLPIELHKLKLESVLTLWLQVRILIRH